MRLRADHQALVEGRTLFPIRIKPVSEMKRLLQPVGQNGKVGKGINIVTKGKWRGMPCFTLTLEERATCPTDCGKWAQCYGNNMRFASRVSHADPQLLMETIEAEVKALLRTYKAILVRPHILGDFFSVKYAAFWATLVARYPGLHMFGFTHHKRESDIGYVVQAMNAMGEGRSMFRFSDQGGLMSANVEGEGIQCPEQTGKTHSCMTCGICWSTDQPVNFKEH